jgi:hypothetical protein
MTLAEFLTARLDEDELAAKAATPGEWAALDGGVMSVEDGGQWPVSETESTRDRGNRVHIARHDPARVLREVEAGRKILAAWEDADRRRYDLPEGVSEGRDPAERLRDDAVAVVLDEIVAIRAAVYSDHEGYLDEWRI